MADVLTGGTASADSVNGADVAARAVDDNESTYWQSGIGGFPHWFKYDLGVAITKIVIGLRFKTNTLGAKSTIKDFTLQGSNNDSDWSTLLTAIAANTTAWQQWNVDNSTAYRYYKLNITSSYWGSATATLLREIEMMEELVIFSCEGFPYTFPIAFAKCIEIAEFGIGYDSVGEAVTLTVAETGTGTDVISELADLTKTVYQMELSIIPKDLLDTKSIPKDIFTTKIIPKDILDTEVKGG